MACQLATLDGSHVAVVCEHPRPSGQFYNRAMSVFALGLNHTTAPVDLRGRFALNAEQLTPALLGFREQISHAHEVAIVSTCNRTELYVGADPAWAEWVATRCASTAMCWKAEPAHAMLSGWPVAWIRWCWASPKYSAR